MLRQLQSPRARLLFPILLCLGVASAQTAPSASPATATVSGQVVDSVSGQGIPRALVELRIAGSPSMTGDASDRTRHVLADPQGQFRFEGVPLGQGFFSAYKPGYVSLGREQDSGRYNMVGTVRITAGELDRVTLRLVPQGIVVGRVLASTGEPIDDVRVSAYRWKVAQGRGGWHRQQMTSTDEDGRFRLPALPPGRYYFVTTPTAVAMSRVPGGATRLLGYAAAHYPGLPGASLRGIALAPAAQLDLRLVAPHVPLYRFGVAAPATSGGAAMVSVEVPGDPEGSLNFQVSDDSKIVAPNLLPAGEYIVRLQASDGSGHNLSDVRRVALAADTPDVRLSPVSGVDVPVRAQANLTEQPATSSVGPVAAVGPAHMPASSAQPILYVQLSNDALGYRYGSDHDGAEPGRSVIRDVFPGEYEVTAQGARGCVEQLTYNGSELPAGRVRVTPNGGAFEGVTVDCASLRGTVKSDRRMWVVAVAQDRRWLAPSIAPTDADGTFALPQVAPGRYIVYALDSLADIEYSNVAAMEELGFRGVRVDLAPGQKSQVSLIASAP
jgi:hypothetical protein